MPNGGSDCCGTCWFNVKNEDQPGYHGSNKGGKVVCTIRSLEIENPFYTYCINHPHHNPKKVAIPLGPVYSGDDRELLVPAPDNESTRKALLEVLAEMEEAPLNEYPFGTGLDEAVIGQIAKLKEKRAIVSLKKIVRFNPLAQPADKNPIGRNRIITVGLALETLATLSPQDALIPIEELIGAGLESLDYSNYNPKEDQFSAIRYHAVRALKYCPTDNSIALLKKMMQDPHQEIRAFSKDILEQKIGTSETQKIEEEINSREIRKPDPKKNDGRWWEFWKMNK